MTNSTNPTPFFPMLQTERLILRPLSQGDADFVFQHFQDPQVTRYLMDEPPVANHAQAQAIIDFYTAAGAQRHNRWVIVLKDNSELIGTCGYHKWDAAHSRAEIGYDLSPAHWRQGYMTEALRAVIQHGFTRLALNRIEALVYPANEPSIQLLRRLGFRQEAHLRDYFCLDGVFYDHVLFALLQREWQG